MTTKDILILCADIIIWGSLSVIVFIYTPFLALGLHLVPESFFNQPIEPSEISYIYLQQPYLQIGTNFNDVNRISIDFVPMPYYIDNSCDHIEANQSVDASGIQYPVILVHCDSILVVGNKDTDFSYHDNYYTIQYIEVESPDTIAMPCILNEEMAARVADRKPVQTILPDIPQVRQLLESDRTYRISALPNWSGFQVWNSKNRLIFDITKEECYSHKPDEFIGMSASYN